MAIVNYSGVLAALVAILQADTRLGGARIYCEEDPLFGAMDAGRCIAVYLTRRQIHPDQALQAGKSTRWLVGISIWTFGTSLESFKKAQEMRDALTDQLELVLNDNRTISGTVDFMYMNGGDFLSAQNPGDNVFVAGAETSIACQVSATSP